MAARERYSYNVICPGCKQVGRFFVSEEDHPYMRSPDRRIDQIEGDFSATVNDGVQVIAACKKCGAKFDA